MFCSPLFAIVLACAGLTAFSSVYAAPIHGRLSSPNQVSEVEPRQVEEVVEVAVDLITAVFDTVKEGIENDNLDRGMFTQHIVEEGVRTHPEFNWIICHTEHETDFKGVQGTDWGHDHKEFDIQIGGTIGYEVYYVREGDFYLEGDGGYLNWAMNGYFERTGDGGKHVVFTRPPGT